MSNIKLISRRFFSFISVLFLLIPFSIKAETQPKFTIEPLTPTTFELPVNLTATIVYRVTNATKITRTLTMSPISGVTQITSGAGVCSNPFTLAYGQSCLLTLQVSGAQMQHTITEGPLVCKTNGPNDNTPDPFLCSQPSALNSLHIAVGVAMYSVGGTISDLTASGLILQNNGINNLSVAANSASFLFPPIIPYGGSYNITVLTQPTGQICLVSNGSGTNVTSNVTTVVIHCYPNLTLTAAPSPQKEVGANYSQTNTATGGSPPYAFSVLAGTIPHGTTLQVLTDSLTVTGTPTASGPFSYTIKVTDNVGLTATASSQGTISPELTLTATNSTYTEVGVSYSQTNVASGGHPPYSFTKLSGSLPLGTSLNATTGTVSGTPTTAGNFSYTIQVEDLESVTKTATTSGTINGDVTLVATPSTDTIVGDTYSQANTASGGTLPYTFSLYSGSLPSGTNLNTLSGTVSGTPTTSGPFAYVIKVTDNTGKTAIASTSGTIDGPLTLTAIPSTTMVIGQQYSQANVATGGTPTYTYTLDSGTLPAGTTLQSDGTVFGTPTASGPFSYVIKVTDSLTNSATAPSSGIIQGQIIFMSSHQHNGKLGGTNGADAICKSDGITKFPHHTFKALIVTSTRYPCSNSSTAPHTYTTGCMGTYSADWPLTPGILYVNPDLTPFSSTNTNGVFDGSANQFQQINGSVVPDKTTFWVGFQSTLSGSTFPYDIVGWAYENMNVNSELVYEVASPRNCSDFSSFSTQQIPNGSLGYTGEPVNSSQNSAPQAWGNWTIQIDGPLNFVTNAWNSLSNNIPVASYYCSSENYIICVGN